MATLTTVRRALDQIAVYRQWRVDETLCVVPSAAERGRFRWYAHNDAECVVARFADFRADDVRRKRTDTATDCCVPGAAAISHCVAEAVAATAGQERRLVVLMLFSSKQSKLSVIGREAIATLVAQMGGAARLRIEPWHIYDLAFDPVTHVDVPSQQLATDAERRAFDAADLPLMRSDDPIARWKGFEAGQIVRSDRQMPELGLQAYWRLVVDVDPLTADQAIENDAGDMHVEVESRS